MSDSVSSMLTTIRNASRLRKHFVDIRSSKHASAVVSVLKKSGYVWDSSLVATGDFDFIRVLLKYAPDGEPVLRSIDLVSRPGNRVYVSKENIPAVMQGLGICVLSTDRGVLSDRDARLHRVGGELICRVY